MKKKARVSKASKGYFWEFITEEGKTIANSTVVYEKKADCFADLEDLIKQSKDPDFTIEDATVNLSW